MNGAAWGEFIAHYELFEHPFAKRNQENSGLLLHLWGRFSHFTCKSLKAGAFQSGYHRWEIASEKSLCGGTMFPAQQFDCGDQT